MPTIQELISDVRWRDLVARVPARLRMETRPGSRPCPVSLSQAPHRAPAHLEDVQTFPFRGGECAQEGHSLLLLDGQQRLTSLHVLFEGEAPPVL